MKINSIEEINLKNQFVFLRLDLNVPLKNGQITDDSRIRAALPTLKYVLDHAKGVVVASHLGRPKGKPVGDMSLEPVAAELAELTGKEVVFYSEYMQESYDQLLRSLKSNQFIVLENLRFHPEEEANGDKLTEKLLKGIDVYVNDAFGTLHRAHASISGVPDKLPKARKACGFLVRDEVDALSSLQKKSQAPYTVVIGGAKVKDKIQIILELITQCNHLIIGGAMAYSFLKFQGHSVGKSMVSDEQSELVKMILENAEKRKVTVHTPIDHIGAEQFAADAQPVNCELDIPSHLMGLDIGPKSVELFSQVIQSSKTVFWNGPMGVFEWDNFSHGTKAVAEAISLCKGTTVVGGGDSAAAINQLGIDTSLFSHISTGGGASLEYLEGKVLPGIRSLEN